MYVSREDPEREEDRDEHNLVGSVIGRLESEVLGIHQTFVGYRVKWIDYKAV